MSPCGGATTIPWPRAAVPAASCAPRHPRAPRGPGAAPRALPRGWGVGGSRRQLAGGRAKRRGAHAARRRGAGRPQGRARGAARGAELPRGARGVQERRRPRACPVGSGHSAAPKLRRTLPEGFVPLPRSRRSPGPAGRGAFLSPSAADVICPVTEVNKRSPKKYYRGLLYDSTDVHLYFICLPGVAPCLGLIGLAVLGKIFLFFPPDVIRFAETRSKQRGDTVLNHYCWMSFLAVISPSPAVQAALFARKRCGGALVVPRCGHRAPCEPRELRCSFLPLLGLGLEHHKAGSPRNKYACGVPSSDNLGNNLKTAGLLIARRTWALASKRVPHRGFWPRSCAGGEKAKQERLWFAFLTPVSPVDFLSPRCAEV